MAPDPYDMMQLDRFDVPAAVLAAAGRPLVELIGDRSAAEANDLVTPPTDGWRVIAGDVGSAASRECTLAAPWIEKGLGNWTLLPRFRLRLRNEGSGPWQADGMDADDVMVWALGPDGERLMMDDSAWFGVGVPVTILPSLEPGAIIEMTGTWQQQSVERLPAGEYALEARLECLELNSSPGILRLR